MPDATSTTTPTIPAGTTAPEFTAEQLRTAISRFIAAAPNYRRWAAQHAADAQAAGLHLGHAQAREELARALGLTDPATPVGEIDPSEPQPGFTGPLSQFLEWISDRLRYGALRLSSKLEFDDAGSPRRRLELVSGGWSEDEALLHRVRYGVLGTLAWESSHRGGLDVYLIPADYFETDLEMPWIMPD